MSGRCTILVTFPGEGKLFTPFEPGRTLAEFRDRLETAFSSTYSREVEVEALLHPDFYPEEQVALPLNGPSDTLLNLPGVVAKFQYRQPGQALAPATRKRRFDRRPEAAREASAPAQQQRAAPESGEASPEERDEEAEHSPSQSSDGGTASGRFYSTWRQQRLAMQAKAAEEAPEEPELEGQEQEVDNVLRREQVYLPGGLGLLDSIGGRRRLEVLHESELEQEVEDEDCRTEASFATTAFTRGDSEEEEEDDLRWGGRGYVEEEDSAYRGRALLPESTEPRRVFRRTSTPPVVHKVTLESPEFQEFLDRPPDDLADLSFSDEEPAAGDPRRPQPLKGVPQTWLRLMKGEPQKGRGKGKQRPGDCQLNEWWRKPPPRFEPPETLGKEAVVPLAPWAVDPKLEDKKSLHIRMQKLLHRQVEKKKAKYRKEVEAILEMLEDFGYNEDDIFELLEQCRFDMGLVQGRVGAIVHKKAEALELLEPFGVTEEEVHRLFVQCNFDVEVIERKLDALLRAKQRGLQAEGGGLEEAQKGGGWVTVITHRQEIKMHRQELGAHEMAYLERTFGGLLEVLQGDKSSSSGEETPPEEAPGGLAQNAWKKVRRKSRPRSSSRSAKPEKGEKGEKALQEKQKVSAHLAPRPSEKLEELKRQWTQQEERREAKAREPRSRTPQDRMPEETSIDMMTILECRNLLLRMKPLTQPPQALYEVLAKRAVREYLKFQPRNFFDCQDITFWQFTNRRERDCMPCVSRSRVNGFAAKAFFDVLNYDGVFLKCLQKLNPICTVYMLYTMQQSGNHVRDTVLKAGRYLAEHVQKLCRDSLAKLAFVFAATRVTEPGLFWVVGQEVLRRCAMKEGGHSLCPRCLTDLFFAFGRSQVYRWDFLEQMMLRMLSLFDADVTREVIDPEFCAPTVSYQGILCYAQPFKMRDLNIVLRALCEMRFFNFEFFNDIAEYTVHCLEQSPEVLERFIGDKIVNTCEMSHHFVRAKVNSDAVKDLFAIMEKWCKEALVPGRKPHRNAKFFRENILLHRKVQEKEDRKRDRLLAHGPERKRGAVGRGVVEDAKEEVKVLRRDRAREIRERLAEMSPAEEAAGLERLEATLTPASVLMSGYRYDAYLKKEQPVREGKRKSGFRPGAIKEASLMEEVRRAGKNETKIFQKLFT